MLRLRCKLEQRKTVKSFYTKMFEVEMIMDENGRYRIRYWTPMAENHSEWITDYGTASYMFDLKIAELEGH